MINLEQFYFQGSPGEHYELSYKLKRCGFSIGYFLNNPERFYFIENNLFHSISTNNPIVDNVLGAKVLVSSEEYKSIVNEYIQQRILSGDWWLELQKGDEVEVLDMFPTNSYYGPEHLRNCGKIIKIKDIAPLIISKNSMVAKAYSFNGDYSAYVILGEQTSYFSWMFVPKNTTPIEKIALSSIVLPKIIL